MIYRIVSIIFLVASLILMVLPYGVRVRYFSGGVSYFSYFSEFPPFGGANFFPWAIVLLSVLLLFRVIININDCVGNYTFAGLLLCIGLSILHRIVFFGVTGVGFLILIFHMATLFVEVKYKEASKF